MDLLMAFVPTWLVPVVGAVCGLAAAIVAAFPAPKAGVGAAIWPVLNVMALNVGHAKNAPPKAQ
jgi:hypothetical protein